MRYFRCSILILALLAGCQPTAEEARKLTDLYASDKEARRVKLEGCQKDAGFLRRDFACSIAAEVEKQEGIGSFRDLPPLDLEPQIKSRNESRNVR